MSFSSLRVTSPGPTFWEGGKRKLRESKLNFPSSVMRGDILLALQSANKKRVFDGDSDLAGSGK